MNFNQNHTKKGTVFLVLVGMTYELYITQMSATILGSRVSNCTRKILKIIENMNFKNLLKIGNVHK